jgi:hypothetical protein
MPLKTGKKRDHDNVSSVTSPIGMNHFVDGAPQGLETTRIFLCRLKSKTGRPNACGHEEG